MKSVKGVQSMEFRENALDYEDYCRLRESVEWLNFSKEQTETAINHSLYTVTAVENNQVIGMGRLVGDGMYYLVVDIVVHPAYQKLGIGSKIVNRIIEFADKKTPAGGRSSIQLIAVKGKEGFYKKLGFKAMPDDFGNLGMRKVIRK